MNVAAAMNELEGALSDLVPVLSQLRALLIAQREAIAAGDLSRLLAVTTEQEEASARLQFLEQRRARLQAELEATLAVRGLRALAAAALPEVTRREEFLAIAQEMLRTAVALHAESERAAVLLTAAIEVSLRTRGFLHRSSGGEPSYSAAIGYRRAPHAPPQGGS
ncbi:MAG TPA: flagellar export chaperone FlgN [Chloroflexota bacterium]|jgi:flagellar biosynthesis/type III secretory pathway chaperone|nr:flagellar export chaperone FlgN [Chloroflexota bacterium]